MPELEPRKVDSLAMNHPVVYDSVLTIMSIIRNGELIPENGEPTKHFHFQSEASMGSPEELGVVTGYTSRLSLPITGRRLCEARSSLGRI